MAVLKQLQIHSGSSNSRTVSSVCGGRALQGRYSLGLTAVLLAGLPRVFTRTGDFCWASPGGYGCAAGFEGHSREWSVSSKTA